MSKHTEEVKDYIFEHITDNVFKKTYTEMSKDLGINVNLIRLEVLKIVKDGLLEVIQSPTKGRHSSPIYKLKTSKFEMRETSPLSLEIGDKTIDFQGVQITLILHELNGYCISGEDLSMATMESEGTLKKIVSSNPELFKDHVVLINGRDYYDNFSTMTYMIKLNTSNVHPKKREFLALFQQSVISVMCVSTPKAKLTISEDHRISIKHNLQCILEISKDQVEEMLSDLESQVSNTFDSYRTKEIQCNRQISKIEKERSQLINRLESEKRSKDLEITKNRELSAKLLER